MPRKFDLGEGDAIVARVRGDGRDYFLNLYVPSFSPAFFYQAPFRTTKDEWVNVRVPLSEFYATSHGRRISAPKLDASQVYAIGFLLADKKAGPFRLQVNSIRIAKAGDDASLR